MISDALYMDLKNIKQSLNKYITNSYFNMHVGHRSARLLLQHLRGRGKSITTSLRPDVFTQLVPGQSELHIKSPLSKKRKKIWIFSQNKHTKTVPHLDLKCRSKFLYEPLLHIKIMLWGLGQSHN